MVQPGGGQALHLSIFKPFLRRSSFFLPAYCIRWSGGLSRFSCGPSMADARFIRRMRSLPVPLAHSRFSRRVAACENRSAAPAAVPCFIRRMRSLPLPEGCEGLFQGVGAGQVLQMGPVPGGTAAVALLGKAVSPAAGPPRGRARCGMTRPAACSTLFMPGRKAVGAVEAAAVPFRQRSSGAASPAGG